MAATQLSLDRVFAYVIVLTAISYLLYLTVDFAERKIVFWRTREFARAGS
jgi:ABC-type nitrate/sulfonate/bicarbonate transport system permease component